MLVTATDKDVLLPDSKFYSVRGRYVNLLLQGYDRTCFPKTSLPADRTGRAMFIDEARQGDGTLPDDVNEANAYSYIIGVIYYVLGCYTIWIRIFNICISILSVFLLSRVAERLFGQITAKLFLLIALFLPTQFGYSITLSRDFLRVLVFSIAIWILYNMGGLWQRRSRSQS